MYYPRSPLKQTAPRLLSLSSLLFINYSEQGSEFAWLIVQTVSLWGWRRDSPNADTPPDCAQPPWIMPIIPILWYFFSFAKLFLFSPSDFSWLAAPRLESRPHWWKTATRKQFHWATFFFLFVGTSHWQAEAWKIDCVLIWKVRACGISADIFRHGGISRM